MTQPSHTMSVLRQAPLFARMTSTADLAQLERVAVVHTVASNELIIADGREVTALHVIRSGEVSVCFSGGSVESLRLGAGSLFGEMEFFQGTCGLARVVATQPTELISVRSADLRAIVRENPMTGVQLYYGFLTTMVGKHELVTNALVDAKLNSSRAHLLHELHAPLAALQSLADPAAGLPAPQHELLCQVVDHLDSLIDGLSGAEGKRHSLSTSGPGLLAGLGRLVAKKQRQWRARGGGELVGSLPAKLATELAGPSLAHVVSLVSDLLDHRMATAGCRKLSLEVWGRGDVLGIDIIAQGAARSQGLLGDLEGGDGKGATPLGGGVGLATARRRVASWGGEMVVEAAPVGSLRVEIRLPARPSSPPTSTRPTPLHVHGPTNERVGALFAASTRAGSMLR